METMNVTFDELSAIAFEQHSSKPELQGMTSRHISSGLAITPCERIEKTKRSKNDQKPTRNGKKTKSQEQDKEISQKSQPDQSNSVKERNKRESKVKNKVKGPKLSSVQSFKAYLE
ncbi:hypothetical protein Tco_1441936 [Tanacetum coccineum]